MISYYTLVRTCYLDIGDIKFFTINLYVQLVHTLYVLRLLIHSPILLYMQVS